MEETPGENSENVRVITPAAVEKPATKKKVRVVKKIVKKKIIKKVPKRVSVASSCDDLDKVTSPNPYVNCCVEIEKPDVGIGGVKEVEDVKMLEGSDQIHDKVHNQIELQDGDQKQIGLQDSDNNHIGLQDGDQKQIGLQDGDRNQIKLQDGVRNRIKLQDGDQNQIELQDCDHNKIELLDSDQNQIKLQDGDQKQLGLQDSDHNHIELQASDHIHIELQDSDHNQIQLQDGDQNQIKLQDNDLNQIELLDKEDDTNTMNVEEHEGEEHDINTMNVEEHEGEECVNEPLVNNKTDGLKSQEALSNSKEPSGKTVASRLHMKQMRKIFIHGLSQETKEEDIRKVFEEIGEVVEVKIIINFKRGKNRGFGFITFASSDLANLALIKYHNVEICGRPCVTSAIEGIDTILLNNIDKKWNNENVVELLQKLGINKADEVLVVPDPENTELNCGFAFLEFETKRDAQMAYYKLQNENFSGKHSNIKVSWASRFVDPVEEEINNIKSVYAENIPLSWDEKEVNEHFKTFGEIESIALAKNLLTVRRNDFAFINYKTREAALSCVEALTCKKSTTNNGSKVHLKVSLSKSIPKVKPVKTVSDSAVTEASKTYQKPNPSRRSQNQYQSRQSQQNLPFLGVYNPPQKVKNMVCRHEDFRKDSESSTTAELVQLLREQASWKHGGPSSTAGHHQPPFGGKQPFTEPGSKSLYHHDPRTYHQSHPQIPNVTHHRPIANVTSFPRYDQQRVHHTSGSLNFPKPDPRHIQARDQTTYPGNSSVYRHMY